MSSKSDSRLRKTATLAQLRHSAEYATIAGMEQVQGFYELAYLLPATLDEEAATQVAGSLRDTVANKKAVITDENLPRRRVFAYPVKRHREGYFGWIRFVAAPDLIGQLTAAATGQQDILRVSVTKAQTEQRRERKERKRPAAKPPSK